MKYLPATLFIATVFCAPSFAQVCGLDPGYKAAETPRPLVTAEPRFLAAPRLTISSLRRGFRDTNPTSCSNYGVLTVRLSEGEYSPTAVYRFAVVQGDLPEGLLPNGFVEPINLGSGYYGFKFYWLDVRRPLQVLEPLRATIEVSRMTYGGEASELVNLQVFDAGGVVARVGYRWNSIFVWLGVSCILFIGLLMRSRQKASSSPTRQLENIRKALAERSSKPDKTTSK